MKIFLSFFLAFFTLQALGQKYSQYNTGTLYESFENPSIQSFTPDSSRRIAFNFLLPSISGNFYLTGNAQSPLKSRAFSGRYNASYLRIDEGRFNRVDANANVYLLMLRIFKSVEGNTDMGFSIQTRGEGRGIISDESVALFNGLGVFPNDHYEGIFNNQYRFQSYNQFSFSYRESVTKKVAIGFKVSALLGINYQDLDVNSSSLDISRATDQAALTMAGTYRISYSPGGFNSREILPTFRNPGASVTFGTSIRTRDNFLIQANIKDLGFIHWSGRSNSYNFNATRMINEASGRRREDSIYKAAYNVIRTGQSKTGSFITPTNAKLEVSANKSFWLNDGKTLSYSPTLIGSKELFFPGTYVALVNPVQYKNVTVTATTSYDSYRVFHIGGQFMVKGPNAEFFIGSERFSQTGRLFLASRGNQAQIDRSPAYTGADFFIGASFKFGSVIEHPMNASVIPMGDDGKGFFRRLWDRLFHKDDY
jgi:hypothetical protein